MELLIAVAIVVILAGIGVPTYLKFQKSAKHAEASTNLNGIKQFQETHKLSNGIYLACTAAPRLIPNQDAVAWTDNALGTFGTIGFATNGPVRFVYAVSDISTTSFLAEALGNTNADGKSILFLAGPTDAPHVILTGETASLGTDADNED